MAVKKYVCLFALLLVLVAVMPMSEGRYASKNFMREMLEANGE